MKLLYPQEIAQKVGNGEVDLTKLESADLFDIRLKVSSLAQYMVALTGLDRLVPTFALPSEPNVKSKRSLFL